MNKNIHPLHTEFRQMVTLCCISWGQLWRNKWQREWSSHVNSTF